MSEAKHTVQLFATCLVDVIRPMAGLATLQVLERLGVTVTVPTGQTCCGQPAFNTGCLDDARAMARYTIDLLERSPVPIVVPSGSCGDMIVHRYRELLADDPAYAPKAERVAARTYELSQYLVEVLKVEDVGAQCRRTIAYHPSCHLLRGLGVRAAPARLLEGISGACCVPLSGAEDCCGFGGAFAVKMGELSSAILSRKLDAIVKSGADTVVACDAGCLLHIEGGLRRRGSSVEVRHLAEVLAESE
ncbi:MAG: Fe-S oxidoreductase [Acidobacteria bacterium]|jgi:L-lactate dehydrogenase complex protein LldE|nr:Fe-S oxidoreductase [Acidobacteriota bacterium]MBF86184.1 Fe-S oxidoreductase [Acidobacteriota bacterium]MCH2278258.1 (Fe-S)-binding protein [Vicinamibacterales bacterium]MEC7769416.1 (Fe-S)-binding protein [Acidobacteriota bacterium]|tara:strand:- start:13457 stop:14197 length:741 start_codon:yes stop_codon:yes gene_type:complete